MESRIDEKYRLMVLQYCLENAVEKTMVNGQLKWVFACPFCGPQGQTEGKKKQRKGGIALEYHSALMGVPLRQGRQCAVLRGEEFCQLPQSVEPRTG